MEVVVVAHLEVLVVEVVAVLVVEVVVLVVEVAALVAEVVVRVVVEVVVEVVPEVVLVVQVEEGVEKAQVAAVIWRPILEAVSIFFIQVGLRQVSSIAYSSKLYCFL